MQARHRLSIIVSAVVLVLSVASLTFALEPGDGYLDIGGGKVWYRVLGDTDATPILTIHGGPGIPSYYISGMSLLSTDRPVIYYDQLGCGRSGPSPDTSQWTIEYYLAELDTLQQRLGLEEFHLYGHSWGSILAVEYALRHPTRVKSLILAGPALSIPRWSQDADSLLRTLPDTVRATIATYETAGAYDAPEYQACVMDFYHRYLARREPWSADLDSALMLMNSIIYLHVCGPSEFAVTGTLKSYNCSKRLGDITVPSLLVVGEYDEILPATASYYQSLIPNARLATVKDAGHLMMHDQPEENARVIREFLRSVESE